MSNCLENLDSGYLRHAGWSQTTAKNQQYAELWSPDHLCVVQHKINQLLEGVGPGGRDVVVPLKVIGSVISQVFESHRPIVGDPFSRYIQPGIEDGKRNDIRDITDRTIEIIVTQIRNEFSMAENNSRLSIWSTLYGDFNNQGLRAHPPIKIRQRRIPSMMFNLNY